MYDPQEQRFVPVPQDRPLTEREFRLAKFEVGERLFVKGMAMVVADIGDHTITLEPAKRRQQH